jgi:hypothetical protein
VVDRPVEPRVERRAGGRLARLADRLGDAGADPERLGGRDAGRPLGAGDRRRRVEDRPALERRPVAEEVAEHAARLGLGDVDDVGPGVRARLDSRAPQRLGDPAVARAGVGRHVARPQHRGGAGLGGQRGQLGLGAAVEHDQAAAAVGQRRVEVLQTAEHEPGPGAAAVAAMQERVVEHEPRRRGRSLRRRR